MRSGKVILALGQLATLFFFVTVVAQQQNNRGLTFEGVVTDSTGAPIVEAEVSIASAGRVLATTNTDGNGVFQIHTEGWPELTLVVKSPGFATHELQLSSSSQSALRVTLVPATVSAQVIVAATRIATPQSETAPSVAVLGTKEASSQFDDDQNVFRLAPYFTLDAFVARRMTNRLEIFGAIENVLNQRYEVGKTPVTTLGPPILLRGGLRLQLGQR